MDAPVVLDERGEKAAQFYERDTLTPTLSSCALASDSY